MMIRTGQVSTIGSRDFQNVKLWSFKLEGSDRYYRTGKDKPPVEVGEWIVFEEANGVVNPETIQMAPGPAADVSVARTGAEAPPATAPATSANVNVGERIRFQAARADAVRLVVAALQTDHLPHAANVAKGKRLDLLLGYVDEVTKALLEQEEAA